MAAGLSRATVSLIERGHLDRLGLRAVRRVGSSLDVRFELLARWRGGDLGWFLDRGHANLAEAVTRYLAGLGWVVRPEVSFAHFGERGAIDLLAWHRPSSALLVIELKTQLVDLQGLLSTLDRKRRLGASVAARLGWEAGSVSVLVVITDQRTNRRRLADHRHVLRAALPADGRAVRAWLRRPAGPMRGLTFWPSGNPGSVRTRSAARVRVPNSRRAHA